MRTQTWMLLLFCFSQVAIAGPIYRCTGPQGEITFSDKSCPGHGEALAEPSLQPNLYTSVPIYDTPQEVPTGNARHARERSSSRGCSNSSDLRHIDLMLDSLTANARRQRFLQTERSRVLNCDLARLDSHERWLRDAALVRTGSLDDTEREAAEREIESLYGVSHSRRPGTAVRARRKPRYRH